MALTPAELARQLETVDAGLVTDRLAEYGNRRANRISLSIPDVASFGSMTRIHVEIPEPRREFSGTVALVRLATAGSPRRTRVRLRPVNLVDYSVFRGTRRLKTARTVTIGESLEIRANADEINRTAGIIKIEGLTPSLVFLLPGRFPFQKHAFNLEFEFCVGPTYTIVVLEHPTSISLRWRRDDAEYHSLGYGTAQGRVSKFSFFRGRSGAMAYYFGLSDARPYLALATPVYTTGLACLAGSLAVAMVERKVDALAEPALALLILPPFLQVFARSRAYYPSADISRVLPESTVLFALLPIYLTVVGIVLSALVWNVTPFSVAHRVSLLTGIALLTVVGMFLLCVSQGTVYGYRCDECEGRLLMRRARHLDTTSRKTLCRVCWADRASRAYVDERRAQSASGG